MNVIKCINGHFFDADKFQLCPHCGAVAVVNPSPAPSAETKKSHISFWSKKKSEDTNSNLVEMPEGTIGKTIGVFGDEIEVSVDDKKKVEENEEVVCGAMVMCPKCRQPYNALANTSCPNCKPIISSDELDNSSVVFNTEEEKITKGTTVGESLQEAVKKAVSSNEEKTIGFFSTSGSNISVNSEPVVGWLVCIKGKHFGQSFNIAAGRNSIGRSDSNKIIIANDEAVSRNKHAWLTYEPKKREFYIQPGEGSGLSYLNDDNIMESKKLQANDVLEFGNGQYMLVPLCGENFTWEDYINKE